MDGLLSVKVSGCHILPPLTEFRPEIYFKQLSYYILTKKKDEDIYFSFDPRAPKWTSALA